MIDCCWSAQQGTGFAMRNNVGLQATAYSLRLFLDVKAREVTRLLEADGWRLAVIEGNHRQLKHPTKLGRVTESGDLGEHSVATDREGD